MSFTWGAVCRPKIGQSVSGDTYVIEKPDAHVLVVAVIDGLGGGTEAARAAHAAEQTVRDMLTEPFQEVVRRAHTALHSTRGAVMGLLRLDAKTRQASYMGVGNIGVHVYSRQAIKPISKNGIVGFRLPSLLELHYHYDPDDVFVIYSDGVSSHFGQQSRLEPYQTPQMFADTLLQTYGKTNDDATVVVVRAS